MIELPEPWRTEYFDRRDAIRSRLADFARVPEAEYFYELCYCLLTPQSSARHADMVIEELRRDKFLDRGFDPTPYLREPQHYIRFHNVKSHRLLAVRELFPSLLPLLSDRSLPAEVLRSRVQNSIPGLGLKESSHFLRNIGVRGLAILDRHILKHLYRLKVIPGITKNAPTGRQYLEIEKQWKAYAEHIGVPLDELDLLFWSMETGEIRK